MEQSKQLTSLTISDHTLLVQVVLGGAIHVIKHLSTPRGSSPSTEEIFDAALQVRVFDEATKTRLQLVREQLPALEAGKEKLPAEFLTAMSKLQAEITGKPLEEKISIIAATPVVERSDDLFATGLSAAEQILRDGATTIYAPDFPPNELFESSEFGWKQEMASIDAIGGAIGGGVGLLAGGPAGIPAGAATGAAGASIGYGIGVLYSSLTAE
jgi:hypothetical protein